MSVRAADGHLCPDHCRPELVQAVVPEGHGSHWEVSRGRIEAHTGGRYADVWISAPEGESMLVPGAMLGDLIAVLRVAQDVWTRYAKQHA